VLGTIMIVSEKLGGGYMKADYIYHYCYFYQVLFYLLPLSKYNIYYNTTEKSWSQLSQSSVGVTNSDRIMLTVMAILTYYTEYRCGNIDFHIKCIDFTNKEYPLELL